MSVVGVGAVIKGIGDGGGDGSSSGSNSSDGDEKTKGI